jgi:hypothetical protein
VKQTPIIVVAALFLAELLALVFGSSRAASSQVRAESLTLGTDYAGVTLTIDRPAPEGAEQAEPETPDEAVDPLAAGAAEAKKAEKPGREVLELEYQGDKWFFTQPIQFPASSQDISRIVEQLKSLDLNEVPATKAREELLVDDKQGIRITAKRDGRPVVDLIVGTTIDSRTFVRKPNESTIWTVEGLRRDDLARPVDELREHQIFDLETEQLVQLTVARGRGERSFVKKDGNWQVDPADPNWLVDPTKVGGAAAALARLRAAKFADGVSTEVSGLGGLFAGAMISFTAQPEGKTPTTYKLLVGNADESGQNYYVMRADPNAPSAETVYLVAKSSIDRVIGGEETGLDDYRERRPVRDIASDGIQTVTVAIGGRSVTFTKGAGTDEWNPAAGSPFAKADGATIAGLVRKLGTLRADDFVAMPGLRVGERSVTLKELIESFPADMRQAMSMGAGGGTSELEMANVLVQNAQFLQDMARLYAVVYPEGAPAAAAGIQALAGELTGTFVSLRDPLLALAGKLAEPVGGVPVVWTFTTGDAKTLILHVGGSTPDGKRPIYTDAAGDAQVYLLTPDKLGDLALQDLNDLRAPKLLADVPLDSVTEVAYTNAGRTWTFTHTPGGAWAAGPGTVVAGLDPEKIASAVRRVLDLEPTRFVAVAPEAAGLVTPTATVRITYQAPAPAGAQAAGQLATITIAVGFADAEGQRWTKIVGLDDVLASGVFTLAKGPSADLLFDPATVVQAAAAPGATPTTPAATPGEDLAQILGGSTAPAPAPVPPAPPAPAPPAQAPAPVMP